MREELFIEHWIIFIFRKGSIKSMGIKGSLIYKINTPEKEKGRFLLTVEKGTFQLKSILRWMNHLLL
jgi:hypothetical protein